MIGFPIIPALDLLASSDNPFEYRVQHGFQLALRLFPRGPRHLGAQELPQGKLQKAAVNLVEVKMPLLVVQGFLGFRLGKNPGFCPIHGVCGGDGNELSDPHPASPIEPDFPLPAPGKGKVDLGSLRVRFRRRLTPEVLPSEGPGRIPGDFRFLKLDFPKEEMRLVCKRKKP